MWKIDEFFSLEGCPCPGVFSQAQYAWEVLDKIPVLINELLQQNPGKYRQIVPGVWVGARTQVADTARFVGPAIFGEDCEIRPGAFVRSNVIAGNGVVLGNSSEVKQSILFSKVQLPHFNYVGDSVLGFGVHLGAGAITSNLKSTDGTVQVRLEHKVIDTGLRKLGAILGDGVEVGCNSVLNPGTLVGKGSLIYPLCSVRGYVSSKMIYKGQDDMVPYLPR